MIAVGTRVQFRDSICSEGGIEPHSGQTGTVTDDTEDVYVLAFADGQLTWAGKGEVTAR